MTKQAYRLRHMDDFAWLLVFHFAQITVAAKAAGKAMSELGDALWSTEHRRRIWFWRGLVADERRLPPMRWNCTHVWWWQAGRRTGELLAWMIR